MIGEYSLRRREINKRARKKYYRSKNGYLICKYLDMVRRVEGRSPLAVSSVGKSVLTKKEFITWASYNKDFHSLFKQWELSGYERTLSPSIDRIDDNKGYTVCNMQFITQGENSAKSNRRPLNG